MYNTEAIREFGVVRLLISDYKMMKYEGGISVTHENYCSTCFDP